MNAAILQKIDEHERDGEHRGYATFVSPRSGRLVACLFIRDPESWRPLIGHRFEIVASLVPSSEVRG